MDGWRQSEVDSVCFINDKLQCFKTNAKSGNPVILNLINLIQWT